MTRADEIDSPAPRGLGFWIRALVLVLVVPALIVLGYAALSLQGYQNDPQSAQFETWPAGVSAFALAGVFGWICLRPSRGMLQGTIAGVLFVAFIVLWVATIF